MFYIRCPLAFKPSQTTNRQFPKTITGESKLTVIKKMIAQFNMGPDVNRDHGAYFYLLGLRESSTRAEDANTWGGGGGGGGPVACSAGKYRNSTGNVVISINPAKILSPVMPICRVRIRAGFSSEGFELGMVSGLYIVFFRSKESGGVITRV